MQESAYNLFSLQTVSYVVLLEVFIAIHTKYVSLGKLNKSQLMVELRSALGQYLSLAGHMLYFDFFSTHVLFSLLSFLLLPCA